MRIVKNGDVHVSAPFGMSKKEVERFIEEHREWIAEARKKTCESQKCRANFYHQLPLSTREECDNALLRLKVLIEPMVESHSREMGVKPSAIRYRAMISRWGVCHVRNKSICFSLYLLRFHALMDKFFPRWKEARRTMHQICKMDDGE